MGTLSKIQRLASWCFHPEESSNKYSTWAHPLFSIFFASGLSMASMIKLTEFLERKFPHLKGEFPEWAQKKLPFALACYLALMIFSRVRYFGPVALYDFLWACNISILLMIVGMLKKSNLMISCSMILIAIDQMLWYIDVFGYLLFGKFYIGVAAFLKWPNTAFIKKITTTHHIWFIPLALAVIRISKNISIHSYLSSVALSLILVSLGRVIAPKFINTLVNGKEEKLYTNLNLAWEVWKDIKLPIISKYEKSHFIKYAGMHSMIWNGGNLLFFALLKGFLKVINQ